MDFFLLEVAKKIGSQRWSKIFFFFLLEVAKKRKPTSMDLFIYLFLLEVAKKWETNVKGLTTLKKKKNRWCKFLNWGHVTLDVNSKDMVCLESIFILVSYFGLD